MMLAQRILDTLRAHGPIGRAELANWFRDADNIDFDTTLTRLMKQNSVSFELGRYDLIEQKSSNGHKPFIATASCEPVVQLGCNRDAVPTAGVTPAEATAFCLSCNASHPESAFPRSKTGKLYSRCKQSYGAMASKGRQAAKVKREQSLAGGRATLTAEDSLHLASGESSGSGRLPSGKLEESAAVGASAQAEKCTAPDCIDSTEKRGNNRDVSAERCCVVASVPETSGSYSRSDPREDVRTPAGDSIAFPRSDTTAEPTDPFLAKLMRRRARLLVERQAIDGVLAELERVEGVYRGLMGEGE